MKHLSILITCLLCTGIGYSQTVQIQAGTTITSLDWKLGSTINLYEEPMIGYAVFAGLQYLDKRYFNLSSNIGMLRKGGKQEVTFQNEPGDPVEKKEERRFFDYISINTTLDVKYPVKERYIPYISIGPRYDYLVYHSPIGGLRDNDFGIILGGGLKYNLSPILIGLKAEYYHNFIKIAEWPAQYGNLGGSINDQTMTLCLTLGYKLG